MKKIWETGIILFSVMGFWGMIYPDLCFTEDICAIVRENIENADTDGTAYNTGSSQAEGADDNVRSIGQADGINAGSIGGEDRFTGLCEAEPCQIRFKSRFVEVLKSEGKGNSDGAEKE